MARQYINVPYTETALEDNMGNMKQDSPNLKNISVMSCSLERLASFRTWPNDVLTSAVNLADCGFYHTQYKDEVMCCECGVRLKDWKDYDSPYERHIAESPHCQYLALRSLQHKHSVRDNANKHKEITKEVNNNLSKPEHTVVTVKSNMEAFNVISNENATGMSNTDWYTARQELPSKHVDYLVETNRFASFVGRWPVDSPVNPAELVQAGLYYVGPNDRVQCGWCRGRLYNWEADDSPINEHARHFPKCPFVISKMHERINFPTQIPVLSQEVSMLSQEGSTKSNDNQDMPAVHIVQEMGYKLDIIKKAVEKWRSNSSISSLEEKISVTKLLDYIFEIENEVADSEATSISNTVKDKTIQSSLFANKLQSLQSKKLDDNFVNKLQHENQELKEKTLCKICLDNEVDMLLLPCRHLVCCSRCGDAVTQCPMCRTVIIGTVKTYLS